MAERDHLQEKLDVLEQGEASAAWLNNAEEEESVDTLKKQIYLKNLDLSSIETMFHAKNERLQTARLE